MSHVAKYCYSLNEEDYKGPFDTREDAFAEALSQADDRDDDERPSRVWTGVSTLPDVACRIDPDEIIEHLAGRAADDTLGTEHGDDWPNPSDAAAVELAGIVEAFNAQVDAWVARACPPIWFGVAQVQEHPVPPRFEILRRQRRRCRMGERLGDWMQTFTGRKFWPFDPLVSEVSILDIAHHLSMDCRFSGAVLRFYSVAQHSVFVSHLIESATPALRPHALMHDAHEAYFRDRIRPVKNGLRARDLVAARVLSRAEGACQRAIEEHCGIWTSGDDAELIAHADLVALATERRDLMRPTSERWITDTVTPFAHTIDPMPPERAEMLFLERFVELFPGVPVT